MEPPQLAIHEQQFSELLPVEVIVYSACVFLFAVDAVELKGNSRAREPRELGEQDPTEYNCPDRMTVECTVPCLRGPKG